MNKVMTVNFRGAELTGFKLGTNVYVPLKPIVDAMGLVWNGQLERLKRSQVLKEGMRMIRIPFTRGGPQDSVCLDLSLLHGWLFTIDESRIKNDAVRAKVVIYQRECFRVLADHFLEGRRVLAEIPTRDLNRYIKLIHEARMIYGTRVAAQLWYQLGMPKAPGMANAFAQLEIFEDSKHQAA